MSMDMPVVVVMLGVLMVVLVTVPLVGMAFLAGRESRGHRSRKHRAVVEEAHEAALAELGDGVSRDAAPAPSSLAPRPR